MSGLPLQSLENRRGKAHSAGGPVDFLLPGKAETEKKQRQQGMKFRHLILIVLALFSLVPAAAMAAGEPRFFSSVPDLPLMDGLQELTDQTVVFDKPEGRIIESVALMGAQDPASVTRYYNDSLPQFGWIKVSDDSFRRENEILKLYVETQEGKKFLHVTIAPASGSAN